MSATLTAVNRFELSNYLRYIRSAVARRLDRKQSIGQLFADPIDLDELRCESEQRALLLADEFSRSLPELPADDNELASDIHLRIVRLACIRAVDLATSRHWIADRVTRPRVLATHQQPADCAPEPSSAQPITDDLVYACEDDLRTWLSGQQDADIAIWALIHWRSHSQLDVCQKLRKSKRDVSAANRKTQDLVDRFISLWAAEHIASS